MKEVEDGNGLQLTGTKYRCWLDVDAGTLKAYADQIGEQVATQEKLATQLQSRLDNKRYIENAPKAIVAETHEQLQEAEDAIERLKAEQARFS